MLDGDGFLTETDVHLSLSFAPDGTDIAGQTNSLAATFDSIAPTADWQEAILRAFQTWAIQTNSDIGRVSDSGDPFGSPGPIQHDDRFGDVRIGAISMSPEVGAVSVPVDGLVSGTWFADVVFNTAFDYQSLDDIFAVALHEAGNVLGLEDNNDPTSPLFTGASPTGLPPTTSDIANLHQLHGARLADINETDDDAPDNDSIENATRLKLAEFADGDEGTAPSIVYGDITSNSDRDFFELRTPGDYVGPATLQLRSDGISLLAPTLTLYDESEQVVSQLSSASTDGDVLVLQIPTVAPDQRYYVEVTGAAADLYGIGGYSLVLIYDGINQVNQVTVDSLAAGQFRFLEQDDFREFFDADDDDLLGDDQHTNDNAGDATTLKTTPGFVESNRYEVVGSIADATDTDFYKIESPEAAAPTLDVMTILVRSLDAGRLVPSLSVFDSDGQPVPVSILANGGGDYIVQAVNIAPDSDYRIKIEANRSSGPFNSGNYNLAVVFGSQPTQLDPMSAGTVGGATTQNVHTLFVGQPQLFHFALQVDPATLPAPTAVVATIKNELGESVYRIATQPGEIRSREAVLLAPGVYAVEVIPFALDGGEISPLSYALLGTSISDLFVGDPDDPNAHPFECSEPGLEGFFCYPGDFVSPDPFLWDTFIDSLSTPPETPDLATLVSTILGDWWTWVWEQAGVNGPPLAVSDTTQVPTIMSGQSASFVGPNGSVLDNDIDPENGSIVAILQSGPSNGTLIFENDGTFTYTPNEGFQGRDAFTYLAFDFIQQSAATTVAIIVGESADFDADGNTDGGDFLTWQRNHGAVADAVLTDGDSNFDGAVNAQDVAFWEGSFGPHIIVPNADFDADFDSDGDTDGTDFLTWQRSLGTLSGAGLAEGDSDADGDVDAQDLVHWNSEFGASAAASRSLSLAETSKKAFFAFEVDVPARESTALRSRPTRQDQTTHLDDLAMSQQRVGGDVRYGLASPVHSSLSVSVARDRALAEYPENGVSSLPDELLEVLADGSNDPELG
ncbi:Ig-like domain-containing protein [Pirellulales bacterium]|nr:Ig-like domain-containing protein [Pirellulales bacterium]